MDAKQDTGKGKVKEEQKRQQDQGRLAKYVRKEMGKSKESKPEQKQLKTENEKKRKLDPNQTQESGTSKVQERGKVKKSKSEKHQDIGSGKCKVVVMGNNSEPLPEYSLKRELKRVVNVESFEHQLKHMDYVIPSKRFHAQDQDDPSYFVVDPNQPSTSRYGQIHIEKEEADGTANYIYFSMGSVIGRGSFGNVYAGKYSSHDVAIKIVGGSHSYRNTLLQEYNTYMCLQKCYGIPKVFGYGNLKKHEDFFILELLGYSLKELADICGGSFSAKTVALIALQLIRILKCIHRRRMVYRNINPKNCMMGTGRRRKFLYLVDFNLTDSFGPKTVKEHVSDTTKHTGAGSSRYKSINSHRRMGLYPKDDMESLGYMLIQLLRGRLQWDHVTAQTHEEMERRIFEYKVNLPLNDLCAGCPIQVLAYFKYIKEMENTATPNYDYVEALFRSILTKLHSEIDYVYDWTGKVKDKKYKELQCLKHMGPCHFYTGDK